MASVDGLPVRKERAVADDFGFSPERWPWEECPRLLDPITGPAAVRQYQSPEGWTCLITVREEVPGLNYLLWVEGTPESVWGSADQQALCLAGDVLARLPALETDRVQWHRAVRQRQRQRAVEDIMTLTGRLAHDLGNVFTGVLGFAELALTQAAPGAPAHNHIKELYQTAHKGAQMVHRLAAFSRRRPTGSRRASLGLTLTEESSRVTARWAPAVVLVLDLPKELPPVALDPVSLRQLLGALLDNAREAIPGQGRVTVSARGAHLTEAECLRFLGRPTPGPGLELTIADTGSGVPADIHERLLNDLFFTTKPGHRGLGLALAYGQLLTSGGGFRFDWSPNGGTTVHLVLPGATA
jgi:signal transduction histidine kinase